MKYLSTRGGIEHIPFKKAVMMGLATDGGLLLPETMPNVDKKTLSSWHHLSYQELALEVFSLFIDDIPRSELARLIEKSYGTFRHKDITPLVPVGDISILELFHGPTLAFKDVALQFLGNVFEYLLCESGTKMNILGATSGDTGSAAIYGVRGKENMNIYILHPHKRVSPIQELQMTSVLDPNVFNIAIKGTFDDGQQIVKAIFGDIHFKTKYNLGAVNSINWARVLAQVVYYVFSYLQLSDRQGVVDFSIPTGNFGDIFAGYVARNLLGRERIDKLVLATNENDILSRFILGGDYSTSSVVPTASPSMDIQMASNFERYLYYLNEQDAEKTSKDMAQFSRQGKLIFDQKTVEQVQRDFDASRVDQKQTIDTIREFYKENHYVLDPHTAVGVCAALQHKRPNIPMVALATAHPGKFDEAVQKAIGPNPLPEELSILEGCETKCTILDADTEIIKKFVQDHAL